MKRIKPLAVFFSIGILLNCYFIENNGFLVAKAQSSQNLTQISNQSNYQKSAGQISKSDFNLFISILNNLKEQLNRILAGQISKKSDSIFTQKKSDESVKLPILESNNKNAKVSDANVINTIDDYYKKFADIGLKINFSNEEILSVKKGSDNKRALTLEELVQQADSGQNLSDLKYSFGIWHNFDERVIYELKMLKVGGAAYSFNRTLINWFQYHSDIAEKFSKENMSASQIKNLYLEFKTRGEAQNLLMKNSTAQMKNSRNFSLVNSAEAVLTCMSKGLYAYFGGMITLTVTCNDGGQVFTVLRPCGGQFYLSLVTEVANPYFHGFPKMTDNILGAALNTPGACTVGSSAYTYDANISYFGASGGL
jgi:hypothetical protein